MNIWTLGGVAFGLAIGYFVNDLKYPFLSVIGGGVCGYVAWLILSKKKSKHSRLSADEEKKYLLYLGGLIGAIIFIGGFLGLYYLFNPDLWPY